MLIFCNSNHELFCFFFYKKPYCVVLLIYRTIYSLFHYFVLPSCLIKAPCSDSNHDIIERIVVFKYITMNCKLDTTRQKYSDVLDKLISEAIKIHR